MRQRTWDEEVTLLGAGGFRENELGQQIPIQTETAVCCVRCPVSRQEFYLAGQHDIRVSEILIIHPYEYSGENEIVFRGKRLRVVKTYEISMEELELTCSELLGSRKECKDGTVDRTRTAGGRDP